jgi:hypothetical protein
MENDCAIPGPTIHKWHFSSWGPTSALGEELPARTKSHLTSMTGDIRQQLEPISAIWDYSTCDGYTTAICRINGIREHLIWREHPE